MLGMDEVRAKLDKEMQKTMAELRFKFSQEMGSWWICRWMDEKMDFRIHGTIVASVIMSAPSWNLHLFHQWAIYWAKSKIWIRTFEHFLRFFGLCSVNLRWYLAWISSIRGVDHRLFPTMSCVLWHHSRIWRILAQRCQARGWKKRRVDLESVDNFDHFDWHLWCWICWIWAMTCLQHQVLMHIAIACNC